MNDFLDAHPVVFAALFVALAVYLGWEVRRGLVSGEMQMKGPRLTKTGSPILYWIQIGTTAGMAGCFLFAATMIALGR